MWENETLWLNKQAALHLDFNDPPAAASLASENAHSPPAVQLETPPTPKPGDSWMQAYLWLTLAS